MEKDIIATEKMINMGLIAMVENYVNNEINYIKNIGLEDYNNNKESYDKDLKYLENLSYIDIVLIKNMCIDDKVMDLIKEKIHDKLYDYQILKDKK